MKVKRKKIGKTRQREAPRRTVTTFPQVNGKVIESVEASSDDNELNITINIDDRTALDFVVVPDATTFHVMADYADWKTGNFRAIKRWPRVPLD